MYKRQPYTCYVSEHSGIEDRATHACTDAAAALRRSGVRPESLAEYVPESRLLLVFPKPATMRPIGEVWRLGSLLLDTCLLYTSRCV